MLIMKNSVKKLVKEGLGKIGDKANESFCPIYVYQPKACKRGESLSSGSVKESK